MQTAGDDSFSLTPSPLVKTISKHNMALWEKKTLLLSILLYNKTIIFIIIISNNNSYCSG